MLSHAIFKQYAVSNNVSFSASRIEKSYSCFFDVERNISQVSWGPQVTECSTNITLLHQNVKRIAIYLTTMALQKSIGCSGDRSMSDVNEGY